jgi:hypothetical protein
MCIVSAALEDLRLDDGGGGGGLLDGFIPDTVLSS